MAKKKLSREERKRREEARKRRVRRRTGWTGPESSAEGGSLIDPELKEILTPLGEGDPEVISGNIFEALTASVRWADEPEFEEIIFDPMKAALAWTKAAEDRGWTPETFGQLEEEESEGIDFEISAEVIPQLLTPEISQQLLHGFEEISRRFKREGKMEQAVQAGFIRLFLKDQSEPELWSMVGLLHAILQRSVLAGFSLSEVFTELDEVGMTAGDDVFSVLEAVETGGTGQKIRKLMTGIPGIRRLVEKDIDKIREDGFNAMFHGDLYLGIYTEEEQTQAVQMLIEMTTEAAEAGTSSTEVAEEKGQEIVENVDAYVARLFTPERLDQLRTHLDKMLQKRQVSKKWLPFVSLMRGYLDEEDAAEYERPFFVYALMGEIRTALEAALEEE